MTDLEIMQRAKSYIDKMANGIDPVTDREAAETDMINNVRISRCLFYVSDVLRQVIENGGVVSAVKKKKAPFCLTDAQLAAFRFSDTPIPISEITKRFNELAEDGIHAQLKHTQLTAWLISAGALQVTARPDGKTGKAPTDHGVALGITTEQRTGQYGTYTVTLYNKAAQQFLVDHLPEILEKAQEKETAEAQEQPWTREQEDCMIDLFTKKVPVPEIAVTLKRTESGVKARLKKLGLID